MNTHSTRVLLQLKWMDKQQRGTVSEAAVGICRDEAQGCGIHYHIIHITNRIDRIDRDTHEPTVRMTTIATDRATDSTSKIRAITY